MDFFATFEAGKNYYRADSGFDPVRIVKRTDKTVWVRNLGIQREGDKLVWVPKDHTWMARIKRDDAANEYFEDSGVPKKYRDSLTVKACWEVEDCED